MAVQELERELRQSLVGAGALLERDIRDVMRALNSSNPEAARDYLLIMMPDLVSRYGERVSGLAADVYDELRFEQGARTAFRAEAVASTYATAVTPTVRRVAGDLFTGDWDAALAGLLDKVPKYALDAGRMTIVENAYADPDSGGWSRVTRAGACNFCVALAARGRVYRRSTAPFAAHGHCRCSAVPSFDKDAPEVPVDAYVASVRTTNMSPAAKARQRLRTREWIASLD